jgi:hypothetical protein
MVMEILQKAKKLCGHPSSSGSKNWIEAKR